MTTSPNTQLNTFSTATEMRRALCAKRISAVELLDLHLQQSDRHNEALNAIVTPNFVQAREMALAADESRARGDEKPLLGVPTTIKDCIYMKGLPTTGGVASRADKIDKYDAPVTYRVRGAGATILGKTNVPPYAADWQANNPVFGRSNNPWDLARTPGGSTGGGAAALAAGLTPLEFGGDFGGSIRIPAAFCGVYGHKPSETLVPQYGHFPGPNSPNPAVAMAVQGPLARSAEDLELALEVIAGPGVLEDVAWRVELPAARHKQLADYRVAVMPPIDWVTVDDEILAALDDLATNLGKAGAKVVETKPDRLADLHDYFDLYLALGQAIVGANKTATAADYLEMFGRRERYRFGMLTFFKEWDILLAPANITNAFPHDDDPLLLDINGEEVEYDLQWVYASLCNLSGHPGTAFPVGQTQGGLPIGLQAIGPYLEDRTPIRFAGLVAQEFGGFQTPPGYET